MKSSVPEQDLQAQDSVFFLHIPKTAGLSFAALLDNCLGRREIAPFYDLDQLRKTPYPILIEQNYFRGHIPYGLMRLLLGKSPVCLTLLREPVERFVSDFAYTQRHLETISLFPGELDYLRELSLADYVDNNPLAERLGNRNCQTEMVGARFKLTSPEEIYDVPKAQSARKHRHVTIEFAKEQLNDFAFVGLTERFQASLFLLAFTFGWQPIMDFQTLNVSPSRPRGDQIAVETRQQIEKYNALDLELYRYAEQLFEARFTQMTQALLERYGTRAQAHLKVPLPVEELYALLEKHYEHRYAERHPLVAVLNFNFDQALPGSGWHAIQTLPEFGAVRWTGPGTQTRLDLPLVTDQDLNIQFRILMALAPDILESLTLKVNEQLIPLTRGAEPPGAGVTFHGCLPRSVLQPGASFTRLVFEVNRTLAPKTVDPHNGDERLLGVLFNWIKIFPAN